MKLLKIPVLLVLLFVAFAARAQVVATISVSQTPANVTVTAANAAFFVLFENSAAPSAVWSVTPSFGYSQASVNEAAGAKFVFTYPLGRVAPPAVGTVLGTVQSVGAGPYNFVLVQYAQSPSMLPVASNGVPSGSCGQFDVIVNTQNGDLYTCNGGSYAKVGNSHGTAQQTTFSSGGLLLTYGNYTAAGLGLAPIVGVVSCTQATCAGSATTIVAAQAAVQHRASIAIFCASVTSTATVTLTISYTGADGSSTAQSFTTGTATCTSLGASSVADLSKAFVPKSGTNIQYNVTTANSPQYQARVVVYQESGS